MRIATFTLGTSDAHAARRLDARDARHAHVHQHEIGNELDDAVDRVEPVAGTRRRPRCRRSSSSTSRTPRRNSACGSARRTRIGGSAGNRHVARCMDAVNATVSRSPRSARGDRRAGGRSPTARPVSALREQEEVVTEQLHLQRGLLHVHRLHVELLGLHHDSLGRRRARAVGGDRRRRVGGAPLPRRVRPLAREPFRRPTRRPCSRRICSSTLSSARSSAIDVLGSRGACPSRDADARARGSRTCASLRRVGSGAARSRRRPGARRSRTW